MYEIIDNNGTIHSGNEDEMALAFSVMESPEDYSQDEQDKYLTDWSGDLKLIQIISLI